MDAEQTRVYVPDVNVAWVEAKITKGHVVNDKTVEVVLEGDEDEEDAGRHPPAGTIKSVDKSTILLQNTTLGPDGCDDMVNLNYLHEPAILYNLKQRFFRQIPYTYTGPICIAVNPYAWLDIYTSELQEQYLVKDRSELPPHVYATSAGGYQHMRVFGEDQSILVSGESGAGKTETTKILMSHLALAGEKSDPTLATEKSIIDRVLHANPLMESFGNAKTSRNDNSSRFGKFSELQFNQLGQLIGAKSRTYLLEKSRVSLQGDGERNYHIFYQLLSCDDALADQVQVKGRVPSDFPFTAPRSEGVSDGMKDAQRFKQTRACLDTLGVGYEDQVHIFQVVAAILHLSRLDFQPLPGNDDASQLASDAASVETQSIVTQLLSLASAEDLQTALCQRQMTAVNDSYQVPLTVVQAQGARTALSVALYSHLFQWLIHRVNASTSAPHSEVATKICILDIFGFEIFEKNSFEQLCINYANEKLQQKFTQDVFKTVQTEYEDEGIPWTKIEFADNANVLALLEGRFGVLALLNEECLRPKGSDAAFANKLKAHYADNDRFETPRLARDAFTIKHYAGPVQYDTKGFLVKNTDALQNDLLVLIGKSSSPFVKQLFAGEHTQQAATQPASAASRALKKRTSIVSDTVGTQFKSQLNGLMEDIRRTNVHYIRCIKPNSRKSPHVFCKARVTEQLQCAGVVEAVRISRMAFPNRVLQTVFLERFRGLAAGALPSLQTADDTNAVLNATKELLTVHLLPGAPGDYQLGKTRVFFKKGALEGLEERRARKLNEAAVVLQRYVKKWRALAAYRSIRKAVVQVQKMARAMRARALYQKQRKATVLIQSSYRRHQAMQLLVAKRREHRATQIQTAYKRFVCLRQYRTIQKAILKVQSVIRMFVAVRAYVVLQDQAQEDAKLENQIRLLKQRLQEERDARMELEQGFRSSMYIRSNEALEGADEVIDQLRRENAALKDANTNLKAFNAQLRKEKETMERGAYVNGASFAAANQRATKLQDEVETLKSAHARIKETHRLLKTQNLAAIEKVAMMQHGMTEALTERNLLRHSLDRVQQHVEVMQVENDQLAKANARLRLILRQDPELSRRHRDEVPRLTKLNFAAKQSLLAPKQSKTNPMYQNQNQFQLHLQQQYPQPPQQQQYALQPSPQTLKVVDLSGDSRMPIDTVAHSVQPPLPPPSPDMLTPPAPAMLRRPTPIIAPKKADGAAKTVRVVSIREAATGEDDATAATTFTVRLDNGEDSASSSIRQPTGEDGPLPEPARVMGLIAEPEPEAERVSFSVTLNVDPAEEVKKEKATPPKNAVYGAISTGTNNKPKGRGRRGSNDSGDRYMRRGSNDSQDSNSRGGNPLRSSFVNGQRPSFTGAPTNNTVAAYTSSLRASVGGAVAAVAAAATGRSRRGSYEPNYERRDSFKGPLNGSAGAGTGAPPARRDSSVGTTGPAATGLGQGGKRIEL